MRIVSLMGGIFFSVAGLAQTSGINMGKIVKESLGKANTGSPTMKIISLTNGGLIWVPQKYSRTGRGMDSEMGILESHGLKINFDIGFLAGAHTGDHNKAQFTTYYDTTISGYKTCIGIRANGIVNEISVTTYARPGAEQNAFSFPANFWAFFKGEDDILEILSIVFSYKPKEK